MSRTPIVIFAALAALALVGAPLGAATPAVASAKAREESDKYVLENGELTVWFQGKKPMLKLFPADREDAAFQFQALRVVEFEDVDKDGAPTEGETRASLNLHAADAWRIVSEERDGLLVLTLSLEAPLQVRGPLAGTPLDPIANRDAKGNVTLVFYLAPQVTDLTVGNTTVTLLPLETKFDFLVNAWSWRDATKNLLALEFDAGEGGNATLVDGEERAVLQSGNATRGYFTWEGTAQAVKAGATVPVDVKAVRVEGEGHRHALVYNASGFTTLLHDPILGASDTGAPQRDASADIPVDVSTIPGAGALLAGAAAAAAAVLGSARVARRGRRDA